MEERKVNIDRPALSAEDINKHKDFDKLLKDFEASKIDSMEKKEMIDSVKVKGFSGGIKTLLLGLVLITGVGVYISVSSNEKANEIPSTLPVSENSEATAPNFPFVLEDENGVANYENINALIDVKIVEGEEVYSLKSTIEKEVYLRVIDEKILVDLEGNEIDKIKLDNVKEPIIPEAPAEDAYLFDVAMDPTSFPDAKKYRGVFFEVKSGQGFNDTFYQKQYSDIKIKQMQGSKDYKIQLKEGNVTYSFVAKMVLTGEALKRAQKQYEADRLRFEKNQTLKPFEGSYKLESGMQFKVK